MSSVNIDRIHVTKFLEFHAVCTFQSFVTAAEYNEMIMCVCVYELLMLCTDVRLNIYAIFSTSLPKSPKYFYPLRTGHITRRYLDS